ncbi:hypothetical protein [Psittacid alphaherpesvirus 5]|uniref:Uncharacterized protein n=1 Tax=Psittacid alphaherpesvirus 5 TaxID=2972693 RepID=A0A5P9JR54_9ALPH|nr:hypothetical protein QKU09_gp77 [Psittacid alphaherpesvirus 5]QFU14621.1 hypothetical protein [Psittacid alphaherpesvirus 5]UOO01092.1 hypothetical protein [Psittacid alphaherpesvirus 5]
MFLNVDMEYVVRSVGAEYVVGWMAMGDETCTLTGKVVDDLTRFTWSTVGVMFPGLLVALGLIVEFSGTVDFIELSVSDAESFGLLDVVATVRLSLSIIPPYDSDTRLSLTLSPGVVKTTWRACTYFTSPKTVVVPIAVVGTCFLSSLAVDVDRKSSSDNVDCVSEMNPGDVVGMSVGRSDVAMCRLYSRCHRSWGFRAPFLR